MLKVLNGGPQTIVSDWVGRVGYMNLGIAVSGAMDHYAARAANHILGNDLNEALLEITAGGFTAEFTDDTVICLSGANYNPKLNGESFPMWEAVRVKKGDRLSSGAMNYASSGFRQYLAVAGGIDVPSYLGSKSTAIYGGFGGYEGRALKKGDELKSGPSPINFNSIIGRKLKDEFIPKYGGKWALRAIPGPNGVPDYFSEEGMEQFFNSEFKTQVFSDRSGIRLTGPKPIWAEERMAGGGHPSNITDHGYPGPGCLNISGDTPILFPRECPTSGGYICALSVVFADQWMLGQIIPGKDTVAFVYCTPEEAIRLRKEQNKVFENGAVITK